MNKHLTPDEVGQLLVPLPPRQQPRMTRREKLEHLITLVLRANYDIQLLHGVEYMSPMDRRLTLPLRLSLFALAAEDSSFQADGLKKPSSLEDVINYLDLNMNEVHFLACDCHGAISNSEICHRLSILSHR